MAAPTDPDPADLQSPIFKVEEDHDEMRFLEFLTLDQPLSSSACDPDPDSSAFYNVFCRDHSYSSLRDSPLPDDLISAIFEPSACESESDDGVLGEEEEEEEEEELGLGFRLPRDSSAYGLRIAGIGSDSGSEVIESYEDGFGTDMSFDDEMARAGALDFENFWGSPSSEREAGNDDDDDDFDRVLLAAMIGDAAQSLTSSSVSSTSERVAPEGDLVGDIEWEVFMAVNDDDFGVHGQGVSGDYVLEHEDYDAAIFMLLGDDPVKGNPPASKSYVDNLQKAVLTPEDLGSNEVCAVCKDDLSLHVEARKLPCFHCFHWECIHPWLSIRNTCPVCRYELPSGDPEKT